MGMFRNVIHVEALILFVEVKTRARKTGKKKKKETESSDSNDCKNEVSFPPLLYPRHLCRRVYSFCFSVRPFVCSYVRLFVRS